jgi:hypothetical protein
MGDRVPVHGNMAKDFIFLTSRIDDRKAVLIRASACVLAAVPGE